MNSRALLLFFLGFLLSACGLQTTTSAPPTGVLKPEAGELASATPAPRSPTLPPTLTPLPGDTPIADPPTPTPTPLHPLSIEYLRIQDYPGSEIIFEETLEPGPNYNRYIASYRSEGLKIFALLTIPFGERPATGWPVVVFNHGYIPPEQYSTTERYVAYVDGFARSEYIVFRSDYRGHGNSEGEPHGAYGSPDYTIDVLNAVEALKDFPEADSLRIGMWGHSMGGYITLRSMVTMQDIKAGVIWAGVVASYPDLFTRWELGEDVDPQDPPFWVRRYQDILYGFFGSPETNRLFWDSISANNYLEDLSGPVQLHHGTADESVPLAFSEMLYEQVQAVDERMVEFYTYEGDNHNLSNGFSVAMQRSIDFFDTYVKGQQP
jgi:dipeptidyl aminopeptidase/acylaminoacyl peptidase